MMRSPWILASILSQKYPDGRAVGKYANYRNMKYWEPNAQYDITEAEIPKSDLLKTEIPHGAHFPLPA